MLFHKVRDVGAVLNGTYSALVRRMTVNASVMRRRKSTKTGPRGPTVPPPPPPVPSGGGGGGGTSATTTTNNKGSGDGRPLVDDNGAPLGFEASLPEDSVVGPSEAPRPPTISVADYGSHDGVTGDGDTSLRQRNGGLGGSFGNRRSVAVFEELRLSTDAKGERVRMRYAIN